MTPNTYWLIPCNTSLYDPFGAFENLPTIDWRQSCKIEAGDVVFIYCTRPYSKIMFMGEVLLTDISPECADRSDLPYHKNGINTIGKTPRYGYFRVRKLAQFDSENLNLERLMMQGLNAAPQGPYRLKGKLLKYILDNCAE